MKSNVEIVVKDLFRLSGGRTVFVGVQSAGGALPAAGSTWRLRCESLEEEIVVPLDREFPRGSRNPQLVSFSTAASIPITEEQLRNFEWVLVLDQLEQGIES